MSEKINRVRTSAIVVHNECILTFLAVDPTDGRSFHFLPGGAIEADETASEAAVRETLEETGYQISIDTTSCIDLEYDFLWDGKTYSSLTFFYRGYLANPFQKLQPVQDAAYNKGVVWVPLADLQKVFSYTKEIQQAVARLVLPGP